MSGETGSSEDVDDFDEESIGHDDNSTELGFVIEYKRDAKKVDCNLFYNRNWQDWDGGKVGGRPIWLNPVDLPDLAKQQTCGVCDSPLSFILQIYSPVDDVEEAFHRALYLFCCRNKDCVDKSSVRCLRAQLPKKNPFYSLDPQSEEDAEGKGKGSKVALCVICGSLGNKSCGNCHAVHYCSRHHQKKHWKMHKQSCCPKDASPTEGAVAEECSPEKFPDILFPEFEIVVESESDIFLDKEERDKAKAKVTDAMQEANIWDDAGNRDHGSCREEKID